MSSHLEKVLSKQLQSSSQQAFYPFYLGEHQNLNCRRLHFLGTSLGILGIIQAKRSKSVKPLIAGIAAGYACAWVGHFVFEKNKPASFKQPLKSFASDWRMFSDIVRGRLSLTNRANDKI